MNIVRTVLSYFLGFIALTLFAYLAFGRGTPTDTTWRFAFMVAGGVAALELLVLILAFAKPANRLLIAANIYLALGGLAFAAEQYWFLRGYEQLGLSGILLLMLAVGVVSTIASPAGFVGAVSGTVRVRQASYVLLALVAAGIIVAQTYPAIHKGAGVVIVTGLAYANRALRAWVTRQKPETQ